MLLKWQLFRDQKEQYVMEETKGREPRSLPQPFQAWVSKQNKNILEELESSQANAVISWSSGTHQEITGQLV